MRRQQGLYRRAYDIFCFRYRNKDGIWRGEVYCYNRSAK